MFDFTDALFLLISGVTIDTIDAEAVAFGIGIKFVVVCDKFDIDELVFVIGIGIGINVVCEIDVFDKDEFVFKIKSGSNDADNVAIFEFKVLSECNESTFCF